jgi:hypothetical protein
VIGKMNELEIIGYARLISLIAIVVAGIFYLVMNKQIGRISIFVAALSIGLSTYVSNGIVLSIAAILIIFCIPIIAAPLFYAIQWIIRRKVERIHGPSNIKLKFHWFDGYSVL